MRVLKIDSNAGFTGSFFLPLKAINHKYLPSPTFPSLFATLVLAKFQQKLTKTKEFI